MERAIHHLLTLWSRSYAADAIDEHLSVLQDWAGRWGDAAGGPDWKGWGGRTSPCEPWFGEDGRGSRS
jgi:hypothetical protein